MFIKNSLPKCLQGTVAPFQQLQEHTDSLMQKSDDYSVLKMK